VDCEGNFNLLTNRNFKFFPYEKRQKLAFTQPCGASANAYHDFDPYMMPIHRIVLGAALAAAVPTSPLLAQPDAMKEARQDTAEAEAEAKSSLGNEAKQNTAEDRMLDKSDAKAEARKDTAEAKADEDGELARKAVDGPTSGTPPAGAGLAPIKVSDADALAIGNKIWKNECNGSVAGLTSWNNGEGFASLGIAHFIWFPPGTQFPFQESFPGYLAFAVSQGASLPDWLAGIPDPDCPWTDRADFQAAQNDPKMVSLRNFLKDTVALQAEYAALRLSNSLLKLLNAVPPDQRDDITLKFRSVASTPGGLYALIDYVNFKGEGTNPKERYNDQGWGLLQALQLMPGPSQQSGPQALASFRKGAAAALDRRVANAPAGQQAKEQQWLDGWKNRIATYQ
jgi:hypothetical protein